MDKATRCVFLKCALFLELASAKVVKDVTPQEPGELLSINQRFVASYFCSMPHALLPIILGLLLSIKVNVGECLKTENTSKLCAREEGVAMEWAEEEMLRTIFIAQKASELLNNYVNFVDGVFYFEVSVSRWQFKLKYETVDLVDH